MALSSSLAGDDLAHLSLPVPTLCQGLDSLLGGGIARGAITLFFGARGVGKTSLGIQTAVSNSMLGFEAFFISCEGSFPAGRLSQIAGGRVGAISDLIRVAVPSSFYEQHKLLEKFEIEVGAHPLTSLLVIDSIEMLYTAQLSLLESWERDDRIHEESFVLNKHLGLICEIARSRKIAALITCGVKASYESEAKEVEEMKGEADGPPEEPISARLMQYWSDNIIGLTRRPPAFCLGSLKLNGRSESGKSPSICYTICEGGIVECPNGGGRGL
jgi:DNA repair protein RadB